ncbi:hypothetical protein yc1106_09023 [Curvularia clavata]|uniref:Uncharacterized protein n=1 Tax=Curvularia clavata TaxID=95742 RepID=A0A9Q8ZFK5_CURCL|nr:hypothetical protein yc1106_09023 [Curvularia clavata]
MESKHSLKCHFTTYDNTKCRNFGIRVVICTIPNRCGVNAFSNLGTALLMVSNASKTANGLQQHLVSSLANWAPLISSTSGASRSSGTEVATSTTTTLTKTIPQQTALVSEVVEKPFTSITPAPSNTSSSTFLATTYSEKSAANAPWSSLVFTWANSHTTILSTPILPAKSAIPTTSNIYTDSNISSVVPTTHKTGTPQSASPSTLGPYATPVQGNNLFLPSGIHPASASGNEDISSRARSNSSPQMTQTRLQLVSISAPILSASLMLTTIQTSTPTRIAEIAEAQYVSSGILSTITSLPCSNISKPFTGWTNTSAPKPIATGAAFIPPSISTGLKVNSSTDPLVIWYMSRTSSISSTSTSPPVSKYMDISSFVTRTRTSSSEPQSQAILVASDVNTAITASTNTTLLPIHSPTETVAATPSPPLTTSEAAGVAIGGTAGLLLAIIAAVFVARRYHAARSARQGSDGSSGVYPQLAYLYDPSLGRAESDNGSDDEASTFMSGGATGQLLTPTRSRTPPAPPHNSVDFGYRRLYSSEARYSDPGNPFTDVEDPFLEWRSSDVISTASDTRLALAAAVARYSNGPQKPLPPLPSNVSTHAFRDHIIPSPTLSPITNGHGLRCSVHREIRGSRRWPREASVLEAIASSPLPSTGPEPPGLISTAEPGLEHRNRGLDFDVPDCESINA